MDWYYVVNREKHGPINEETFQREVAKGTITPASLVWNETMEEWEPYGDVMAQAPKVVTSPGLGQQEFRNGGTTEPRTDTKRGNAVVKKGSKKLVSSLKIASEDSARCNQIPTPQNATPNAEDTSPQTRCPGCGQPLQSGAIECVNCGRGSKKASMSNKGSNIPIKRAPFNKQLIADFITKLLQQSYSIARILCAIWMCFLALLMILVIMGFLLSFIPSQDSNDNANGVGDVGIVPTAFDLVLGKDPSTRITRIAFLATMGLIVMVFMLTVALPLLIEIEKNTRRPTDHVEKDE